MNIDYSTSLCSEKFETFEIWAMFTLEGSHIVMGRTDAQNGLDFHFKVTRFYHILSHFSWHATLPA
jgi:hypothetical protein